MNGVVDFGFVLVDLLAGTTLILGVGVMAALLGRAPVHRQRAAEIAVAGTVLWLVLALLPLPRPLRTAAGVTERPSGGAAVYTSTPAQLRDPARADALVADGRAASVGQADGLAGRSAMQPADEASWLAEPAARSTSGGWRPSGDLLLFVVYATGTAGAAAYLLLGTFLVARLFARTVPSPDWLSRLFAARCRALGVPRAQLRITRASGRPLSCGVFMPTVVLPAVLVERSRERDVRYIIDHELTHIRRGDVVSRAFFAAAGVVLWPHPLFWWLRARAALAAELIADDAAAAAGTRRHYARSLIELSGAMQSLRPPPGLVPGTFRNRSELTRRIEMLTSEHDRLATRCTPVRRAVHATAAVLTICVSAALFGARPLPVQASSAVMSVADGAAGASSANGLQLDEPVAHPPAPATAAAPSSETASPADDVNPGRHGRMEPLAGLANDAGVNPEVYAQRDVSSTNGTDVDVRARAAGRGDVDPGYAAALELVERVLAIRTEMDEVRAQVASAERRRDADPAVPGFLTHMQLRIDALQRRLVAVMILVESEIQATQLEIAQVEQEIRVGTAPPEARVVQVRLAGRLKVLQSVR